MQNETIDEFLSRGGKIQRYSGICSGLELTYTWRRKNNKYSVIDKRNDKVVASYKHMRSAVRKCNRLNVSVTMVEL